MAFYDTARAPCVSCGGRVTRGSRSGVCKTCFENLRDKDITAPSGGRNVVSVVDILSRLELCQTLRDYSECPVIRGDCAVISDVHAPYHDPDILSWCVREAAARGIKTLLIAGDLIDWRSISRFPKPNPSLKAVEELSAAVDVLAILAEHFTRIVVMKGNHELRLQRMIEAAMDSRSRPSRILDGFERDELEFQDYRDRYESVLTNFTRRKNPDLKIDWSGSPQALIDGPAGRKPWRVVHQRNGSILPPQEALKHWQRWTQPIITTHTHLWGIRSAPNGEDLLVNIGCATNEKWHEYCNEEPNGYPAWERGFALILGGKLLPFMQHPYLFTDRERVNT